MWFNNLQLYRLTKPFKLTPEQLAEKLTEHAFRRCGSLDLSTYGWVPPLGRNGTELIHAAGGHIMVCARKEEKILPAAVVREIVAEKAAQIEEAEARPVRRKEREELKDNIIHELLPKALTKSSLTFAYISPRDNLIVVNSSGAKRAEELLSALRGATGELAATGLSLKVAPPSIMTRWLNGDGIPQDIVIGDECELRDTGDEGGIIRCKRQDLSAAEIQTHLEVGKQVVKLALEWQEQLSFIVNDDLSIKRLRFGDELQEKSSDMGAEDAVSQFDNDFAIMTLELSKFIPRLIEIFGGETEFE